MGEIHVKMNEKTLNKIFFVVFLTLFSILIGTLRLNAQDKRASIYVKPIIGMELHITRYHTEYPHPKDTWDTLAVGIEFISHIHPVATKGVEMGVEFMSFNIGFIYRHAKQSIDDYGDELPDYEKISHFWEVSGVIGVGSSGVLFHSPIALGIHSYLSIGHYLYKGIRPVERADGFTTRIGPLRWATWGGAWGLEPGIGLKFNGVSIMMEFQGELMLTGKTWGLSLRMGPEIKVRF